MQGGEGHEASRAGSGRRIHEAVLGSERRQRQSHGVESIVGRLRGKTPRAASASIVHWEELPPRPRRNLPFPETLAPVLREVLEKRGLREPYSHQARAIEAALAGRDVLISTATASGKTLCYSVPVLQSLIESRGRSRAIFLYPTKALSQDQTVGLTSLMAELEEPFHAYTYDGDTDPSIRRTLRDRGHLIFTNPWMLHQGILPNHAKWIELFRDLRYVVVDEVHTMSGVFGSSVAHVLRRLFRIARHYGSDPTVIATSATLRDPVAHARTLFGRELEVIDEDGSPSGKRYFALHNPPLLDPVAGLRAHPLEEAKALAKELCGPSHQTIFFCRRRTSVEVLTRYLREAAPQLGLRKEEIRGYRGGYLPGHRREIERGLKDGTVRVVVSTNALELGIDIGALDVAVLVGYPGSQASFWQRAGRVGRRGSPSLVVQIARPDPIDQFLTQHPEALFGAARQRIGIDPGNLVILSEQMKCAAFELPFRCDAEGQVHGEKEYAELEHVPELLDYLDEGAGLLHKKDGTYYWMADSYPAQDVTLAGNEPDNVVILDLATEKAIGEIDREWSITTVHEGAIYQIEGETWRIERFDYKNRRAYARHVDSDYYTDAHTETEVRVLALDACLEARTAPSAGDSPAGRTEADADAGAWDYRVLRGEVHVTTLATMFKKIRFHTRENLGAGDIHLPPEELDTESFLLVLSERFAAELELHAGDQGGAWRAFGLLLRRLAPLFIRCQASDLGISTEIRSARFGSPTLFLYDRVRGGVGLSQLLFDGYRELLAAAAELVDRCACVNGCPACIGPSRAGGRAGKEGVARILKCLLASASPETRGIPRPGDWGAGISIDV